MSQEHIHAVKGSRLPARELSAQASPAVWPWSRAWTDRLQ
jgi:hypothetical protein